MKLAEKSQRNAAVELLRILAMLMVITLHYNTQTGALAYPGDLMTPTRVMAGLTESFCICAVNVYVLISGYYLVKAEYKPGKLVRIIAQVLFYTLLIPVVLKLFGVPVHGTGLWELFDYVLPVMTEHYWFVTAYVLMFIFSPVLGAGAVHMTEKQLRTVILTLLFFFCLIKSIVPVQLVTDKMGYDFGWFLCLFLIAAYIRLHGIPFLEKRSHAAAVYVGSSLLIFAAHLALHMINLQTGSLSYYAAVPFHYNFIFCLTASVGFFYLIRSVRIGENSPAAEWIRRIAPYTFGVYLIHEHIDLRDRWAPLAEKITGAVTVEAPISGAVFFLLQTVASVVIVFVVCAVIDALRELLFRAVIKAVKRS